MNVKTIPSRWLEENGRRLDCGPYMSGAIEARELLKKGKTVYLRDLTTGFNGGIFNGPRFPRTYVERLDHGVPFLGSTDILNADLAYLQLLSRKQVQHNPNLLLDEGWTLITCSGTVGRMAYARVDMKGKAGSQHFMRVVPDRSKVRPGYLYAYLSGRYGIPLVVSGTYGAIIEHIEPHHIEDLLVPRLSTVEERAHELVQKASELLTRYQANIDEATCLYFESAGLEDITGAEWHDWGSDVGFVVANPSMKSLRALNFNPRFNCLCERIRKGPWKPLGELCPQSLNRGGRYRRIEADPEFGYQLIGQKQIFWLRPEGRWVSRTAVGPDVLVAPGTVLVAAQGTLGENELFCRSEFVWGKAVERAYSEHLMRAVADESLIPQGALFAFMRSETAFRMLRSISMGSKLQDHHYKMLPELPVPYPAKDAQREAHRLVVKAYEAREKAVDLEDEARALVEDAIEKGGK